MVSAAQTEQASPAAIHVRGLVTRIGAQTIHDGLDLEVRRGEILGLVGGSGSGKSVLLRTLIGLLEPDGGTVRIHGRALSDLHRWGDLQRCIGVLFQSGALYSSLTVSENIAVLFTEYAGLRQADAEELARTKLALTGLAPEIGQRYPAELSGGMTKRAALARALALTPDLLFLDEPTSGLDPVSAAAFDQLVTTLRDALGLTVFLVTHDLDTLHAACDRIAVLAHGRVLTIGSLEEVHAIDDDWVRAYFHGPRGRAARKPGEDLDGA